MHSFSYKMATSVDTKQLNAFPLITHLQATKKVHLLMLYHRPASHIVLQRLAAKENWYHAAAIQMSIEKV